ncbi:MULTISPECIES: PucR family transcriptional regulator [Staphylococcus]|uniref:PucR family transcriptional regulator n=1 Tax=Staphylococcus TaxID=1279 RepID=UPI00062BEEFA|nr:MULTISPECIES: PucR family transcriptional regulator [Staphylococcus]MDH9159895.1 PucR family transcriptional regulator [Staphylococcus succinus]OIJ31686.1 PucR family transcriptional regulator [Staphylococcus sp. LCT-H4]PNZ17922.1 PucR family transcriptional regulator [Staphylococcus succinus subsp. succinus]
MTTLNEILSVPQFKGLELINKNGDLSSEVTNLDITENNDIKHFTSENSFILTTGVLFQDNQENLKKLIKDLSDIHTAGLGIKTSRFLHEIDQDVIDFADALAFPLIEIPESWNLGEITHQISSYISDSETGKLNYALHIQQELNQLLIKGFSINSMIERMSKLLGVPIILFDPFKSPEAMSHQYKQNKVLATDHIRYFHNHYQEALVYDKNKQVFEDKDHVIFKVLGYTYFPYYLMVSQVNKLSYPFSLLTIEQVVSVLSFALYKNTKIEEAEQNDINRFFESLVHNQTDQALSINKHTELLKQYNIFKSDYYQIIICNIDTQSTLENSYYLNERQQLTFHWLKHMLTDIDPYISIYKLPSNNRFAILLQNHHQHYFDYLKRIQDDYGNTFEGSVSFGIGNEVTEFSQLPSSFFEANEAYENALFSNEKSFISQYHSKDIKELLQLIPNEKLQPFIKHTLGPLSYPKTKKDLELKQTLQVYMDNQCDITKTAEKIYIHRNTVKYRINKCSNMIGTNIEDPLHSLNIRIALYVSDIIDFDS